MVDSVGTRKDPLLAFRFRVYFDKSSECGFSNVSGIELRRPVKEAKDGGNPYGFYKRVSRMTPSNLSLQRGVIDLKLFQWFRSSCDLVEPKDMTLEILNSDASGSAALTLHFLKCIPVAWSGPKFDAIKGEIAVEQLELAYESVMEK